VAVMNKGVVVEFGPAREVMGNPQHAYTRLLLDSIPTTGRSGARPRPASRPLDLSHWRMTE